LLGNEVVQMTAGSADFALRSEWALNYERPWHFSFRVARRS
jgi:hypothetical protein